MKYKICVLTATRAEYGVLRSLLFKLKNDKDFQLQLLVTGTHLNKTFGNTQNEIIKDGFDFDSVPIPLDGDTKVKMATNMGESIPIFAQYLNQKNPNCIIVLGDRYEALSCALSAYILSIPIIHISGGDITEGAIDDGFRHSISKLSSLHFPGCITSKNRLIQMGEQPDSVFFVGDPGVENCVKTNFWTLAELEKDLNFKLSNKKYCVITFHPVTQEENTACFQLNELIKALDCFQDMQFIITNANADAGGRKINEIWERQSKLHSNWLLVSSLGSIRYLSALKYSNMVIGNSSSGIIEAPALRVPTVNIGDRQKGRDQAKSIINCEPNFENIKNAIYKALEKKHIEITQNCDLPFGSGNTSEDIIKILKDKLTNKSLSTKKQFYDLKETL